jgi:hypothetical protein
VPWLKKQGDVWDWGSGEVDMVFDCAVVFEELEMTGRRDEETTNVAGGLASCSDCATEVEYCLFATRYGQ